MQTILDIEDLCVTYQDGTEALRGVSLAVEPAQRVGLIGPNGAGKTSLLLAIMLGVPFTGRIAVDGIEATRRTADDIRSRCGITFQDPDDQLFMPTLLDDVAFGPLNHGYDAAVARAAAEQAIAAAALSGMENRCAHHLSGGQKRNAALATILSMNVKLLLLDEPGASLDFRSRRRLAEILGGRTEAMLLATHDLNMVAELCDRVIVMDGGTITADAPADTILKDTKLLGAHGLA